MAAVSFWKRPVKTASIGTAPVDGCFGDPLWQQFIFGRGRLVEPFSGVEIHMEMDMEWKWSGDGAQFVKIVWIGLDLGQSVALTPCDGHRTFTKRDKSNTETRLYLID